MMCAYKRFFTIVLAGIIMITSYINTFAEVENNNYASVVGDVNGDDIVNAKDALIILQFGCRLSYPRYYSVAFGDVDYDGSLTANDALVILKRAAKIDVGDLYISATATLEEKKYSETELNSLISYYEGNMDLYEGENFDKLAVCDTTHDGSPELILIDSVNNVMHILCDVGDTVYSFEYFTAWRNDFLYVPENLFEECAGTVIPHNVNGSIKDTIYDLYIE